MRQIGLIGRIIALPAILGWFLALVLEVMRPGFVVFFWNPVWLLVLGIAGLVLSAFGEAVEQKSYPQALRIFLAILGAVLVWNVFPESVTGLAVSLAVFLMIAGEV